MQDRVFSLLWLRREEPHWSMKEKNRREGTRQVRVVTFSRQGALALQSRKA